MGESNSKPLRVKTEPIALDTFGGRIHVEWDPAATVTPLGHPLPFSSTGSTPSAHLMHSWQIVGSSTTATTAPASAPSWPPSWCPY